MQFETRPTGEPHFRLYLITLRPIGGGERKLHCSSKFHELLNVGFWFPDDLTRTKSTCGSLKKRKKKKNFLICSRKFRKLKKCLSFAIYVKKEEIVYFIQSSINLFNLSIKNNIRKFSHQYYFSA